MLVHVKIQNSITGQVIRDNKVVTEDFSWEQMGIFHTMFEKVYPDCHVNFGWNKCFICGQPLNMVLDEDRMDRKEMTWDEYYSKWYGRGKN